MSLTGCIKNLATTVATSLKSTSLSRFPLSFSSSSQDLQNMDVEKELLYFRNHLQSETEVSRQCKIKQAPLTSLLTDQVPLPGNPSRSYGFLDDLKTEQYYLKRLFQKHHGFCSIMDLKYVEDTSSTAAKIAA